MKKEMSVRFRTILATSAVALLWLGAMSCGSKPDTPPPTRTTIEPGTTNKFFTATGPNEIVPAEGARFELVTNADGKEFIKVIARDNHNELIACECGPGCDQNTTDPCKPVKPPGLLGWLKATCAGSCHKSEGGACGGCYLKWNPPGGDSGSGQGGGVMDPNIVNAPVLNNP